jgi:hypothetical protein
MKPARYFLKYKAKSPLDKSGKLVWMSQNLYNLKQVTSRISEIKRLEGKCTYIIYKYNAEMIEDGIV